MTYGTFLIVFLLLPIILLLAYLRGRLRRSFRLVIALVCLLAFVYTTPWDNYAAFQKLWTFDPAFVLGAPFWFGWLPLEEYLFYFCEAILVCLVLVSLARIPALAPDGEI